MNIGFLTICVGDEYQKKFKSAIDSKRFYCQRNNYDFLYVDETLDASRKPHWSKVKGLQKYLNDYDWLFYSDADSHIMNMDAKLEDIIKKYSKEDTILIITKDKLTLNSGNFFIKNCDKSLDFLEKVYQQFPPQPIHFGNHVGIFNDQYGFYMMHIHPDFSNSVVFIQQRIINAYPCSCCGEKYQVGDFIIHFVNHKRETHNWGGDTQDNNNPYANKDMDQLKTQLLMKDRQLVSFRNSYIALKASLIENQSKYKLATDYILDL